MVFCREILDFARIVLVNVRLSGDFERQVSGWAAGSGCLLAAIIRKGGFKPPVRFILKSAVEIEVWPD
jgi:hypothetical protein